VVAVIIKTITIRDFDINSILSGRNFKLTEANFKMDKIPNKTYNVKFIKFRRVKSDKGSCNSK
jgi:hypothetical protein